MLIIEFSARYVTEELMNTRKNIVILVFYCIIYFMLSPLSPEISQFLVLGGGIDENGNLGYLSVERAQRAAQFIGQVGADRVVFSGGTSWLETHETTPRSEAEMMAEIAVDLGVPESVVTCEDKSTNTLTNIALSRNLLDEQQPVGIVTHQFHVPRTLRIARRLLGSELLTITPSTNYPELMVHEVVASGMTELVLLGLQHGDWQEAIRRNNALQARVQNVKEFIPNVLLPNLGQKTT